jgi:hypothetical protein
MQKLQEGQLSTHDLIEFFGTTKLKERYKKEKRLGGKDKTSILTKASKYCNIEDLGKGKYIIHKVYGLVKDDQILPLKKGLYKYITPLILTKLLNEQNENYKITLPFLGWARKFDMINDNYNFIKYHQEESCKYLSISEEVMFEYFCKIDDCLKYHLNECLIKLSKKSINLIDYEYITMAKKIYTTSIPNDEGGQDLSCEYKFEPLTDEEHKYVIDCENQAKILANIESEKEKYYGVKSYNYHRELNKLLLKRNILFTYSAFNIFCKNKEGVRDTIDKFKITDTYNENNFISDFTENFIDYINTKAKHRQNKTDVNSENGYRLLQSYLSEMRKLSEVTIKHGIKSICEDIGIEDTVDSILEEFNINIYKKG